MAPEYDYLDVQQERWMMGHEPLKPLAQSSYHMITKVLASL